AVNPLLLELVDQESDEKVAELAGIARANPPAAQVVPGREPWAPNEKLLVDAASDVHERSTLDRRFDEGRRRQVSEQHLAVQQTARHALRAFQQTDADIEILAPEEPHPFGHEERTRALPFPCVRSWHGDDVASSIAHRGCLITGPVG